MFLQRKLVTVPLVSQLSPLLGLATVPREPKLALAGLRAPHRREITRISVLQTLRAHFGHLESLDLLGEAAGHQIRMVMGAVVEVEVVAAAVALMGSPATHTTKGSG